ncbi:hypothetical protein [Stieleria varia]|uniref:Secreted protein n=1 Tax=Stieleria varia TaxID=2528005 RepID=A0A5C6AXB9_9BACT|nr:hypothetical protein [Stieleria varia]TWU04278.1 hypothetical protein Pla52n_23170 [Stieleria varia]
MLRLCMLFLSFICLVSVGCGGSNTTEVPQGLTAPTPEEEKALEDYTASQQIDPKTGQPVGN